MTIATTEPGTRPLTGGWNLDADVDVEAEFAELIAADPELVDIEFAGIIAALGQPIDPTGRAPVPAPGPAPRGWPRPRPVGPAVVPADRAAADGWRRERSPPPVGDGCRMWTSSRSRNRRRSPT